MLLAAFAGFFAAAFSGSMVVGVLAGRRHRPRSLGGFLAVTTVRWRMDQIIAGVVLNIIATGPDVVLPQVRARSCRGSSRTSRCRCCRRSRSSARSSSAARSVIALLAIIAAIVVHLVLFHTRWGLRTRAVGEYPSAADTAGINVERLRMVNVTLAGSLAGLAGIYLSMDASSSFERGIVAGRGFLALAIMIMGAWRPLRAFVMAIFFGFVNAVASQLQQSAGQGEATLRPRPARHAPPRRSSAPCPTSRRSSSSAVAAGRVRAPAAVGQPYVKEDQ